MDRITAFATRYAATLPSFTCEEIIHSEQNRPAGTGFNVMARPVHNVLETRGTLRILREVNDFGMPKEEHDYRQIDARSVNKEEKIKFPYSFTDAFAPAPALFFSREKRACFNYKLLRNRVDFTTREASVGRGACVAVHGQRGFVTFDPATGAIQHFERTIPDAEASKDIFAKFASIDYSRLDRDGQSYTLPSHIAARQVLGTMVERFDARYSECRLHQAHSTILDGVTPVQPEPR